MRYVEVSKAISLTAGLLLALVGSVPASAQSLAKRHQIELRVGGWNQMTNVRTEVGIDGVVTRVASSGFLGGVAYGHWLQEELALRLSVGVMAASIDVASTSSVATVSADFAIVAPLLLGMRYYFPKSTYGKQVRPFAGVGIGTFVGSQTSTQTGLSVVVESRSEAALGGELEAGIDVVLDRYVLVTVAAAYNLMTDFDQAIGGSRNYSGPQMTLGLSLLLGGGRGQP